VPNAFGTVSVAAVDLDRDGKLDLVAVCQGTEVVWRGKGDGSFQSPVVSGDSQMPRPSALAIADMNGDGFADVVVSNYLNVGVTWAYPPLSIALQQRGAVGKFSEAPIPFVDAFGVGVGDLNGDGRLDVVTTNGSVIQVFEQK
jgi:hypothetical protein